MNKFRNEYENIEIPDELEFLVRTTIKEQEKKMKRKNIINKSVIAAAVAGVVFVGSINLSSEISYALSEVPVLGSIVRVLTFKTFELKDNNFDAQLKTPAIEGLDSKLEAMLNEKYLDENQKLYDDFMKEIDELKKADMDEAHMGIASGYEVKTDTDKLLVIGRYVVNTVGSSSTTIKYDTIDKQNKLLITLPSLFKDEAYIEIISENIKTQMKEQMKDENNVYWLEDEMMGDENFSKIDKNQSFYITKDNQLVIAFDKYEVAPGYMGNPEFIIPNELLKDVLVSEEYIK
ncbi:anti-sigma(V) factor [Acetoanaerobium sticklandii]|uniref:Anti-sigma(V) factor n=1 Tax=Acetoanaerobium sticklandii (strain ATCC 12662 / DSM 519 / JCM 1433 / CCUG 9281 / NCIMB 10654 / HF) TaxID=499177 RepID=E3PUQ2_ACESD|nr:RsiV family protein [Acetoanaerobium sticklandii]CBH22490.1 anti-sigma(V) factor [Acetoanaerobium sticklandii]